MELLTSDRVILFLGQDTIRAAGEGVGKLRSWEHGIQFKTMLRRKFKRPLQMALFFSKVCGVENDFILLFNGWCLRLGFNSNVAIFQFRFIQTLLFVKVKIFQGIQVDVQRTYLLFTHLEFNFIAALESGKMLENKYFSYISVCRPSKTQRAHQILDTM